MVSIPPLPHGAWPDLAPELVASERHEGMQCRAKVTEEDSEWSEWFLEGEHLEGIFIDVYAASIDSLIDIQIEQ